VNVQDYSLSLPTRYILILGYTDKNSINPEYNIIYLYVYKIYTKLKLTSVPDFQFVFKENNGTVGSMLNMTDSTRCGCFYLVLID